MVTTECACACHGADTDRNVCGHCWTAERIAEFERTQNAIEDLDYAYTPGDRDENGETDIERARRLDDEAQNQEPGADDEPPPDYGPPAAAR